MTPPSDLQILLDGDVLRYEIGYAAETGWQTEGELPPFEYVEKLLLSRIANIMAVCRTKKKPIIYLSEGRCFRDQIAKTKPYKGTRKGDKPYHYDNLTVYISGVLGAIICRGIEADDQLAIDHCQGNGTIVVSRDKDLRQLPGWFYSWELGNQPSFGPTLITADGHLELLPRSHLRGTGLSFFYAQCLTGDTVDNIPGCKGVGPVKAFQLLSGKTHIGQLNAVIGQYRKVYGNKWKRQLTEQGRLLWLSRRLTLTQPQRPVLWKLTMTK